MAGNSGDTVGISEHVTRARVYEPAFGRLFRLLALTPSRVAGVAITVAILGYLVPLAHPEALGVLLTWAGVPVLAFVFGSRRFAYVAAATVAFFSACAFADSFDRTLVAFVGLGGSTAAIVAAHHQNGKTTRRQLRSVSGRDRAGDVLVDLGACVPSSTSRSARRANCAERLLVPMPLAVDFGCRDRPGIVPLALASPAELGRLAGYAVKTEVEGGASRLPALVGGIASDALLVVREAMPVCRFAAGGARRRCKGSGRSKRLARRTAARLFVASLSAAIQPLLGIRARSREWSERYACQLRSTSTLAPLRRGGQRRCRALRAGPGALPKRGTRRRATLEAARGSEVPTAAGPRTRRVRARSSRSKVEEGRTCWSSSPSAEMMQGADRLRIEQALIAASVFENASRR